MCVRVRVLSYYVVQIVRSTKFVTRATTTTRDATRIRQISCFYAVFSCLFFCFFVAVVSFVRL